MKSYEPYAWTLDEVTRNNFYEVPIYQRPYTWSENEVDSLLDDLFASYHSLTSDKSKQTDGDLFTGQLFLRYKSSGVSGNTSKYEVVDGQQRLSTFSMILISVYSLALNKGCEISSKDISDLRSSLWKYCQRQYNREERLITLSSIDFDIFKFIFDSAYDDPKDVLTSVRNYQCKCWTEMNIQKMFERIYCRIQTETSIVEETENRQKDEQDKILEFCSFLFEHVIFIAIKATIDMPHVFSVFESINSKGKPLEEIDKIKTYIFSVLAEKDYDAYLSRWGQLIVKTGDRLEEYLQIYIKAFVSFYCQRIFLKEFKKLSRTMAYVKKIPEEDCLKNLIDDMLAKVDCFRLLLNEKDSNGKRLEDLVASKEFRVFYKLFSINNYTHPKPLFFRTICEFCNKNKDEDGNDARLIEKKDVTAIFKSATLFMFKFLSIKGGDSKDAIKYFEKIGKQFYSKDRLDSSWIKKVFSDALVYEGIDKSMLKSSLVNLDIYSRPTLAYCILSLIQSVSESNGNCKLNYDQALLYLSEIKNKTIQRDHMLLPQSPDKDDPNFKYYEDKNEHPSVLVLKPGHDFPSDTVINGMRYDEFTSRILNHIGNMQLILAQNNLEKSNKAVEEIQFTSYQQVLKRCDHMADLFFKTPELQ